jgi:PleD family two-component response regulator
VSRVRERSRDGRYSAGTVSIGIASFDPLRAAHTDVESLVRAADGALYRAKGSGRNRVQAA